MSTAILLILILFATEQSLCAGRNEQAHRHLLVDKLPDATKDAASTDAPASGKGSWSSGGSTGIIMTHAALMPGGEVVGWAPDWMGDLEPQYPYKSAVYWPGNQTHRELLPPHGIHAGKNAFCGAHILTVDDEILIFGGHYKSKQWFRRYDHRAGSVEASLMESGRWYPGVATLPDGKVLVVGGVQDAGATVYKRTKREGDNPTITVYDPATRAFTPDAHDMAEQLSAALPVHTYPHVLVQPDGGVVISAGSSLVKYRREGDRFIREWAYPSRPHAPWSYPQTGTGLMLPLHPPYDRAQFLAVGGSAEDVAGEWTPASSAAHVIELTAGRAATWRSLGPAPYPRVMDDALILCDGTVGYFNGASRGLAGWSTKPITYRFSDGSSWACRDRCTSAHDYLYEPVLFDPASGSFSKRGSLARASRPRLYHSTALLLPDCRVMVAGSDVTNENTAEIYSPPYLSLGPRPRILSAPAAFLPGEALSVAFDPAAGEPARALLIRQATSTHSMQFDARALWLDMEVQGAGGTARLSTPPSSALLPPGNYLLVLLSGVGAPSEAQVIKVVPSAA